jgi:RNA polymerase sporulation-specific sigma factor
MVNGLDTLSLIKRAQDNDNVAKQLLIEKNSPLIKSVIRRYKDKGIEYDDLYQLGSLGFLKAVINFNDEFNVKFSTYAVPMIAGEVKRYLRDNGIIKVSRSVKALSIQIVKYVDEYYIKYEHSPSIDEIAEKFSITVQEAVFAMESNKMPISLYKQVGDSDGNKELMLIDKIEDENSIDNELDKMLLYNAIKDLNPRDKKIIIMRYFRDMTQSEIAKLLGVSQVQVSRLENRILKEIKSKIE